LRNSRQSLGKCVDKYVSNVVGKCAAMLAKTGAAGVKTGAAKALILACLTIPLIATAADSALTAASDLRSEAAEAAKLGQPLLILYSRQNCPYCEEVRKSWLLPLSRDSQKSGLKVRQIDQDSDRPLIDFAGQATTHARFAAAEQVAFVPVVAVYGPHAQALAEPIVGLRLRDFYGAYLKTQLDEARARLRQY